MEGLNILKSKHVPTLSFFSVFVFFCRNTTFSINLVIRTVLHLLCVRFGTRTLNAHSARV